MNFTIEDKGRYTLVTSNVDKLDTTCAPELKSELVYLNKTNVRNVIIDLSTTRYCVSSGLSALLVALVSPWWWLLTAFVGLNLLQSSITGFCPAAVIFRRLGVSNGCAFR